MLLANQRVVWLTRELFDSMFVTGNEIHMRVREGLPVDVEFVRAFYDNAMGRIGLIYCHANWLAVNEGERIPDFDIVLETVHVPA